MRRSRDIRAALKQSLFLLIRDDAKYLRRSARDGDCCITTLSVRNVRNRLHSLGSYRTRLVCSGRDAFGFQTLTGLYFCCAVGRCSVVHTTLNAQRSRSTKTRNK